MRNYQRPFDDRHLAVLDIEAISSAPPPDGSFPPWPTFRPVVASVLQADLDGHGEWTFALEAVRFEEDDQPFEKLNELIRGRGLVTYNGTSFDLPVLMLGAQQARAFECRALIKAASQSRYGYEHCDLAQKYSGYGAARGASLTMLCEVLGIPAKFSAHGEDVDALHAAGEIDRIVQYCHGDVCSTALLFAHYRAMESGDATYHASLTTQFVRWVQMEDRGYLAPFAEVARLDQLLQLSLLGQIAAARETAAINADWQTKKAIDASFGPAIRH